MAGLYVASNGFFCQLYEFPKPQLIIHAVYYQECRSPGQPLDEQYSVELNMNNYICQCHTHV